jgi:hypothetical protein
MRWSDRYHGLEEVGRGDQRRPDHRQVRLVDLAGTRGFQGASK